VLSNFQYKNSAFAEKLLLKIVVMHKSIFQQDI